MISGEYTPGGVLKSLSKKSATTFKNEALKSLFSPAPEQEQKFPKSAKKQSLSHASETVTKKSKRDKSLTQDEKPLKNSVKKQRRVQEQVSETDTSQIYRGSDKAKDGVKIKNKSHVKNKNSHTSNSEDTLSPELLPGKSKKRKSFQSEEEDTITTPIKKKKKKEELHIVTEREKSLREADAVTKKKKKKKKIGTGNPEERTLFVGNLPISYTKKDILKFFKKYGDIETVRLRSAAPADPSLPKKVVIVKKETHPDRHNINAYIVFVNKEDAVKALKRNGKEVEGFHIRVDLAVNAKKHDTKHSVFIGNLPFDVEEESLRKHFTDCGDIRNIRIIRDPKTGLGKGFGYIQFMNQDAVSVALQLDGKELNTRKLRICRCVKKEKKKQVSVDKVSSKKEKKVKKLAAGSKKPIKSKQPSNARPGSFVQKTVNKKKKKKGWKPTVTKDGKPVPKGQPNFVHAQFRLRKKSMKKTHGRKK